MMNLQGFRCEGCLADQHCYDFDDHTDCACACPAYCHLYSTKSHDALCGVAYNSTAAFSITNDWICVTCPGCLVLRPPDSLK